MIPRSLSGVTLLKFPTHIEQSHAFIMMRDRMRTELTSSVSLSVDGRHIQPGYLVFSLPPKPLSEEQEAALLMKTPIIPRYP